MKRFRLHRNVKFENKTNVWMAEKHVNKLKSISIPPPAGRLQNIRKPCLPATEAQTFLIKWKKKFPSWQSLLPSLKWDFLIIFIVWKSYRL